ncbi:MAG: hypothetical protein JSS55_09105 [Proteobacteria bacterium]|nr:hypothetical protein [Pseudomonadota bacterium]
MLLEIERFLKARAMAPTLFGRLVARDPRLVHDLRRGREPGPRMRARIAAFIKAAQ